MEDTHSEVDYTISKLVITSSIFQTMPNLIDYGKVFYKTNEDLLRPYTDIDFYEKDVLSVLSSGDHVITARYLESETVYAFDKNRLTLYYFYLRLWSIKYRDELYPNIFKDPNRDWMRGLLSEVVPETRMEQIALDFFRKHINENTCFTELFENSKNQPIGKTIYRDTSDLKKFISPELTFYRYNFFEQIYSEKQYDIILMSNILEWAQGDTRKLRQAAENLANLSKKDGLVLCSSLIYKTDYLKNEKEIFSDLFEQEIIGNSYVYRKK